MTTRATVRDRAIVSKYPNIADVYKMTVNSLQPGHVFAFYNIILIVSYI